tara:strand:+ start:224 stop:640 length:417 start_codon:yes stop_codon:yes gene_type:complete
MEKDFLLIKTLEMAGFANIDIDQILNYLETLEYDLKNTKYVGKIISKNERLAKYFFLRDQLKIESISFDETSHVNEILDQCIDWTEFWRLLVIKKGFCCIRLAGEIQTRRRYIFLSGPNILSGPSADLSDSIFEDEDY